MLKIAKAMLAAAVQRIAVSLVVAATNKLEAAAALEKAEIDAELEMEAQKLEAQGLVKQAQALRLKAASIDTNAPAATALPALTHLLGTAGATEPSMEPVMLLEAPKPTPATIIKPANTAKRGPGRPRKDATSESDKNENASTNDNANCESK